MITNDKLPLAPCIKVNLQTQLVCNHGFNVDCLATYVGRRRATQFPSELRYRGNANVKQAALDWLAG